MNIKKINVVEIVLISLLLVFFIGSITKTDKKEEPVEKIPVSSKIDIDLNKIESISGKYSYDDEKYSSMFGIDISEFNGEIDWAKVKQDNVEFVFIRIGRRGATSGLLYDDETFEINYHGARENGIKIGVYFFSQAFDQKEAIEEAKWVINKLSDKQIELPIVLDCEEVVLEDETPRIDSLDAKQHTDNALAFLKEIEANGYQAMLYTYPYWANNYYEMDRFSDYSIWLAYYDDNPDVDYSFAMWQYSNTGTINGIKGDVDMNIMFIPKD